MCWIGQLEAQLVAFDADGDGVADDLPHLKRRLVQHEELIRQLRASLAATDTQLEETREHLATSRQMASKLAFKLTLSQQKQGEASTTAPQLRTVVKERHHHHHQHHLLLLSGLGGKKDAPKKKAAAAAHGGDGAQPHTDDDEGHAEEPAQPPPATSPAPLARQPSMLEQMASRDLSSEWAASAAPFLDTRRPSQLAPIEPPPQPQPKADGGDAAGGMAMGSMGFELEADRGGGDALAPSLDAAQRAPPAKRAATSSTATQTEPMADDAEAERADENGARYPKTAARRRARSHQAVTATCDCARGCHGLTWNQLSAAPTTQAGSPSCTTQSRRRSRRRASTTRSCVASSAT